MDREVKVLGGSFVGFKFIEDGLKEAMDRDNDALTVCERRFKYS